MKKSNVLWLILQKNKWQQMWRIMKLTWILCVCFVCTLSANVMSQQKLSMNLGETSIKSVFEEIRKQTNKVIIYNDDRLTLNKKVMADFKNMELGRDIGTGSVGGMPQVAALTTFDHSRGKSGKG
ncbi:MAG: hypothetical protein V8R91_13385 [Butyricimonas faecihominis]